MIFDKDTGLMVTPVEEVRERLCTIFQQAFATKGKPGLNTAPETPQGQLIDSLTAMFVDYENTLMELANQLIPEKSEGIWQDALGSIYFLKRHPAVNSTALITCTGRAGTFIPEGALVSSELDHTQWAAVKGGNIPEGGTVDLVFSCISPGPVEAPERSLTRITTTISGWDAAHNEAAALIGSEQESRAAFEQRRFRSVALNSTSSIDSAYSRLADLSGVIAVCIRQNRTDRILHIDKVRIDPHSIYACVLGGDDEQIARALYDTVSAGCEYTGTTVVEVKDENTSSTDTVRFTRPSEQAVVVQLKVRKADSLPPGAEEIIKDVVFNNFYGTDAAQLLSVTPVHRVVMGDDLYASRFIGPLTAAGINEVIHIKLNYATGSGQLRDVLSIPINMAPTLSRDNIKIVWAPAYTPVEGTVMGFDGDNPDAVGFDQAPFYTDPPPVPEPPPAPPSGSGSGSTSTTGSASISDGSTAHELLSMAGRTFTLGAGADKGDV